MAKDFRPGKGGGRGKPFSGGQKSRSGGPRGGRPDFGDERPGRIRRADGDGAKSERGRSDDRASPAPRERQRERFGAPPGGQRGPRPSRQDTDDHMRRDGRQRGSRSDGSGDRFQRRDRKEDGQGRPRQHHGEGAFARPIRRDGETRAHDYSGEKRGFAAREGGSDRQRGRRDESEGETRFGRNDQRRTHGRSKHRDDDRPFQARREPHNPEDRSDRRGPRPGAERRILGREKARRAQSVGEDGALWIYGRHAVVAALANPARVVKRVLAEEGGRAFLAAAGLAPERAAAVEQAAGEEIDLLLHPGAVHQGLAALVEDLPRARLRETCEPAEAGRPVVVLDQITDPQNIGAIMRSAAAFGARAVVVQDRRTPPLAGALAKAAAGAVEIIPCIKVVNVARAVEGLRELGYFCAGLAGEAEAAIDAVPAGRPIALVLGAEGEGLRRLVGETCDGLFRIPIAAVVESLNVSTAAAVSLYATSKARG